MDLKKSAATSWSIGMLSRLDDEVSRLPAIEEGSGSYEGDVQKQQQQQQHKEQQRYLSGVSVNDSDGALELREKLELLRSQTRDAIESGWAEVETLQRQGADFDAKLLELERQWKEVEASQPQGAGEMGEENIDTGIDNFADEESGNGSDGDHNPKAPLPRKQRPRFLGGVAQSLQKRTQLGVQLHQVRQELTKDVKMHQKVGSVAKIIGSAVKDAKERKKHSVNEDGDGESVSGNSSIDIERQCQSMPNIGGAGPPQSMINNLNKQLEEEELGLEALEQLVAMKKQALLELEAEYNQLQQEEQLKALELSAEEEVEALAEEKVETLTEEKVEALTEESVSDNQNRKYADDLEKQCLQLEKDLEDNRKREGESKRELQELNVRLKTQEEQADADLRRLEHEFTLIEEKISQLEKSNIGFQNNVGKSLQTFRQNLTSYLSQRDCDMLHAKLEGQFESTQVKEMNLAIRLVEVMKGRMDVSHALTGVTALKEDLSVVKLQLETLGGDMTIANSNNNNGDDDDAKVDNKNDIGDDDHQNSVNPFQDILNSLLHLQTTILQENTNNTILQNNTAYQKYGSSLLSKSPTIQSEVKLVLQKAKDTDTGLLRVNFLPPMDDHNSTAQQQRPIPIIDNEEEKEATAAAIAAMNSLSSHSHDTTTASATSSSSSSSSLPKVPKGRRRRGQSCITTGSTSKKGSDEKIMKLCASLGRRRSTTEFTKLKSKSK